MASCQALPFFLRVVPETINITISTNLSELPQNTTYYKHIHIIACGYVRSVTTPYDSMELCWVRINPYDNM